MTRQRVFRGVVASGRGLAEPVMSTPAIQKALANLTGLSMVPGTLNVVLRDAFKEKLPVYVPVKELGGLPGVPNRKGLRLGAVIIAGRFNGIVFQGDEPEYPPNHVELISDHKLRAELNLADGDAIEFTMVRDR